MAPSKLVTLGLMAVLLLNGCAYERQREQRDKKLVDIRTQLAAGFLSRGQIAIARDEARKALAIDDSDSNANYVMALIQARLKQDSLAKQYFERAISSNPGNSQAQDTYGIFLCERGQVDQALPHFAKVLADPLYPSPQWANVNTGTCLLNAKRYAGARSYFNQALVIQRGFAPALYSLARLDYAEGKLPAADAEITKYFATGVDSPQSLLLGIKIERALGHTNHEVTYLVKLTHKYPDSPEAFQARQITGSGGGGE